MKSADTATLLGSAGHAPDGPGCSITFRCARCCKDKQTIGRRLRYFLGLRQFVCAACDTAMLKTSKNPWERYEGAKKEWKEENPGASCEEYAQAMQSIAKRLDI